MASKLDELATTQRLLDQVQLSLDRARNVSAQSDHNNRRRYLFYDKNANEDLNTMRAGIDG
jgi:RAQPRD family integrative conjugative element protein